MNELHPEDEALRETVTPDEPQWEKPALADSDPTAEDFSDEDPFAKQQAENDGSLRWAWVFGTFVYGIVFLVGAGIFLGLSSLSFLGSDHTRSQERVAQKS